jgi:hypothetical protein
MLINLMDDRKILELGSISMQNFDGVRKHVFLKKGRKI